MDEKTRQFRIEFQRESLVGDAHDVPALRRGIMQSMEARASMKGSLESEALLVCEGFTETTSLRQLGGLGDEHLAAALFRTCPGSGAKPVVHRFRLGEARLRIGEQSRRVMAVLQLMVGDTDRWWLAWRPFGSTRDGVGVLYDGWIEQEGDGIDTLDEPFREWISPGKAEILSMQLGELRNDPPMDIRMAVMPAPGILPDHPCAVADQIGRTVQDEVLREGMPRLLLFVCRPGVLEKWVIGGRPPVDLDDLIRSVAGQGPAEAVALVHPGVIEFEGGESLRCMVVLAERNGRRGSRHLPIRFEGEKVEAMKPVFKDHGLLEPGQGWLGVAPTNALELFPVGVDGPGPGMGEA